MHEPAQGFVQHQFAGTIAQARTGRHMQLAGPEPEVHEGPCLHRARPLACSPVHTVERFTLKAIEAALRIAALQREAVG